MSLTVSGVTEPAEKRLGPKTPKYETSYMIQQTISTRGCRLLVSLQLAYLALGFLEGRRPAIRQYELVGVISPF